MLFGAGFQMRLQSYNIILNGQKIFKKNVEKLSVDEWMKKRETGLFKSNIPLYYLQKAPFLD